MSESLRPITIRSKFQNIVCQKCDASILIDTDKGTIDPEWNNPDQHNEGCDMFEAAPEIDLTKPADFKLTRLQAKVLRAVKLKPGDTCVDIANRLGHRPMNIVQTLDALERFRHIRSSRDGVSSYSWTWEAIS